MYDVVIIGSGPAGLSASIYAKRAGLKALTLEQNPMSGGQVLNTYEVDNYPGLSGINGFDLSMKFREHADKLGCEFKEATVQEVRREEAAIMQAAELQFQPSTHSEAGGFMIATNQGEIRTRTVLAAMGASHAKLNVPGEKELTGMGVSYCATCDGAFFRGKTTAVVGGGDVAVEDAIFLSRTCEKVYLIHRRNELRSALVLQEEVKSLPNVEILWDTIVRSIDGTNQVEALSIKNMKTGEARSLPLDGVFIAVGIIPSSEVMQNITECDKKGYLIAGEDGACNTPGIFAAGDIRTKKLRQIVTAVADGANAVTGIQEYLVNVKITK